MYISYCCCCQVASVVSDSVRPRRWQPTRLPSLGFSRQEHQSGLPFPSPTHESEKWKWSLLVVSNSATPWTAAYQAPPSMGFSRQKYWSGVPLPSPVFLTKDTLLTCTPSYKAVVIERGSFSLRLSSFSFPSFLYRVDLSFPSQTNQGWPRQLWSRSVGENREPLVFPDALGRGSCLLCKGGDKQQDPSWPVLPFISS